ncbi:phage baseplate upper protein [Bacillus pumilus]|uniref:phage baseplate upper protein n=1 Tax=Bacillus pumilus TaxID=1408 RepID=UPI00119EDAE5|nr:phage baseplate upper protein [Bacillus pumilus]
MSNQIFKNGVLPFIVDAYDQSVYDSKIVFSTQDIGTARLIFKMRKDGVPLPLSAVEGKLVLLFTDGSKHIRNITLLDKVEGVAEYILNKEEIKIYGRVQASLNLFYKNGQSLSVHEFNFDIKKNLIDENIVPAAEYYIDDFQSLKSQVERKAAELEADINKRTDDMKGNIDQFSKELKEQLNRMKEKLEDIDGVETKEGAQQKAKNALRDAKAYTDNHALDAEIHVTPQLKQAWDAKETKEGAQEKAQEALKSAIAHYDNLTWINVTLKNGASTGDRPFQFAKLGGLLLLRGHIKANREIVIGVLPEGAPQPPIKGAVASPSVSGTTGHSKLFLNNNGEFVLTGIQAKNENAVTGYYLDSCIIPLD